MSRKHPNPPHDPAAIETALREFQEYSAPAIIPGRSTVDELIAERRLKAALEVAIDERSEEAYQTLLQKIQVFFRDAGPRESGLLSDELIAERRWEAALENAEADGDEARIEELRRMPQKRFP